MIVSVICPVCGKKIQIDDSNDANICIICGKPFITEKAVRCDEEKVVSLNTDKSNNVNNTPSILSPGFNLVCVIIIVFSNCVIPSKAKNSHCTGIITELDAVNAFVVINPSEGGQSIII